METARPWPRRRRWTSRSRRASVCRSRELLESLSLRNSPLRRGRSREASRRDERLSAVTRRHPQLRGGRQLQRSSNSTALFLNDRFCIENDRFCIENGEFCTNTRCIPRAAWGSTRTGASFCWRSATNQSRRTRGCCCSSSPPR